jgi:hypothetical protein
MNPLPSAAAPASLRTSPVVTLAVVLFVLLLATAAQAMITVGKGNDPVPDQQWPAGAVGVANLKTRLGWWEGPPFGGGQTTFQYRGDTAAFQQALDLFAQVKAPARRLVVHAGPQDGSFLKDEKDPKADVRIDWTFTVWNAESWNHLYNNPTSVFTAIDPGGGFRNDVDPPRLDVYVGGAPAAGQGVDWARVKVPAGVTVADERASANGYPAGTGSVLRGDAYDMATSKPIPGVRVSLQKHAGQALKPGDRRPSDEQYDEVAAVTADAVGHFEMTKVPPGSYRVVASADAHVPRVLGYATFGADALRAYTVRLAAPATLAGTVLDGDGKPAAGVAVRADSVMAVDGRGYLLPARVEGTSDAAGAFTIAGLPKGYCQLFARADGYLGADILKVYAVPTAGLTVRVTGTGTVKGRVTKPGGGPPARTYMASLFPEGGEAVGKWSGSADLAADGTFAFEGVPAGKYVATVRPNPGPPPAKGRDPNEKAVEVRAGRTEELVFEVK